MYILGISAFYHDSAACLLHNAEIIAAAQEERFSRIKHDHEFPINAINFCLTEAGITIEQVDFVSFYDKPIIKFSRILETYLQDEFAFRRGQTLIDVPVRMDEVAALLALQNALRCGISQSGIVVEVNPSSNLLIGDLLDLRNHPILRLFPPIPESDGPPPVAIALGSDDPLTFSTQLLREYTLLHQAARAAGYSERATQDWLESIRCIGMNARFTRAWRPSAKEKITVLINDLSKYLQLPPSK